MTYQEIANYRLASQKLFKKIPEKPEGIVQHLGTMQALVYAMTK